MASIIKFKPQLARNFWDYEDKLRAKGEEFVLTQKLDGVRCLYDGTTKTFWTRAGKPIEGLTDLARELEESVLTRCWLDGELLATPSPEFIREVDRFDLLSGAVRTLGEKHNLHFHVFDIFNAEEPDADYKQRREMLYTKVEWSNKFWLHLLPCLTLSHNYKVVDEWNERAKEREWEGIMVNLTAHPYRQGKRTAGMYKVKRWYDEEFRCVDVLPGEGKHAGRIGAIMVDVDGVLVSVGTGFDDSEREKPDEAYLGKWITVKYFEKTVDGSLRFPVYKGIRED